MNHFSLTIASTPDNLRKVENFIEYISQEFQVPDKLYGRIALPVFETATNFILYENENDPQKTVKLYAAKRSRKIVITVENESGEIDFSYSADFSNTKEFLRQTRRYLYLMISLPDELTFTRNGTKVIMTYFLDQDY